MALTRRQREVLNVIARKFVASVPNPVLSKPFSPGDLCQRVRKLLEEPLSIG